jgi:hypothetical protein
MINAPYLIRIALALMALSCVLGGSAQTPPDGLYMVPAFATDSNWTEPAPEGTMAVPFHSLFLEADERGLQVLIDTTAFVPLLLDLSPKAEQQAEGKQRLLLSLTPEASELLKSFTAERVGETVAIVIDGQVVTRHRVRTVLTSGQLQISWCGPDACEQLKSKLVDNVQ